MNTALEQQTLTVSVPALAHACKDIFLINASLPGEPIKFQNINGSATSQIESPSDGKDTLRSNIKLV